MEPKSERMSLPQWDGDRSGWRDYQQEVRLYKTGENLEVNWSVAVRLVGGLKGAARRVGLAMTDQELLPTARNITDNLERKADRNRRGIEALMTRLEAELGQQRPQKKGESLEMFFVSNKLQRKRGERITDYITRFEEGIKTLQDNDINLLTIDDVPGWMLMRKASLTQERRERLIAALTDEYFAINDVKRVLVRLSPELHINEHRESDGYSRRARNDHENPTQANICRTSWLRESRNQRVPSVDNVVIGLVILNALEIETQISLLGQMINHFQIARTVEPSWWLNGLDNLVPILNVQICVNIQSARILSRIFDVLLLVCTSQFLLLSLALFIQHAQLILKNFVVL